MELKPIEFINAIKEGKTESELNRKNYVKTINELSSMGIRKNPPTLRYLIKYCGHTTETAEKHLNTDYSNGYTICKKCGSFYELGKGFTKHLSNGCLHCEGEERHKIYFNRGDKKLGFEPRNMSTMFDDGMHYCVNKLEIEKFKKEVELMR